MKPVLRRRLFFSSLLCMGFLAGWFTSVGAGLDLPPLPPPPTLPTLPVLPPPPRLPQPPPVPPQLPRVPPVPPRVPRVPVPPPSLPPRGGGGGGAQSTLPLGGGSASSSGSPNAGAGRQAPAHHAGPSQTRVHRLHFSRNWISRTGPRRSRQTMLVFRLGRAAPVEFMVVQVAPDCRHIGRFRVAGHPGVNRVRFRGHIGGRALDPGTYRIKARTL